MRFDVAVVGARCSGATVATLLARRGLRVVLLDKARFPSDTASTHIVQPSGVAVLDRLGVRDELVRRGAGMFERVSLTYGDARLEAAWADAESILSTGATPGLNARRIILDDVLLTSARNAGVDVRTQTSVEGLVTDEDGRVTGVRTSAETVAARVVVGADGRRSTVAREVGAREYATYAPGRFAVWGYFAGAAPDANRLRIGRLGEQAWISCPTDSGLLTVGVVPSSEHAERFLADRERNFTEALCGWPELAAVVEGATREGPLRVVADWRGYVRESAGPGWVLTGDAGNFKDPSAAQGIADALRQAETLAAALVRGLDAGGDVDRETASWWRWRDRDTRPMHWFAADMGAPGPLRPVTRQVIRDVANDPSAAAQFLQVLNRDRSPRRLLTHRRLAVATLHALRCGADRGEVVREVGAGLADELRRAGRPQRRAQTSTVNSVSSPAAASSFAVRSGT